jgi:uncharacterized repeat protein (TIGR03803 family)
MFRQHRRVMMLMGLFALAMEVRFRYVSNYDMIRKLIVFSVAGAVLTAAFKTSSWGAEPRYATIYRFEKDSNENSSQECIGLLYTGSFLFGMTRTGGVHKKGSVFRISPDGTGFKVLHDFTQDPNDGHNPCGGLIADGDMLYGMTSHGGTGKGGSIFRMSTDGSSFKIIHNFQGWHFGGDTPYGSLIADSTSLCGMTVRGGTNEVGVIFRINKDGSGFRFLHSFAGGRTDGASPFGTLVADGDVMYGMTSAGGNRNRGVLFRIGKFGEDYTVLHHFASTSENGSSPKGGLVCVADALYGMTFDGGIADKGAIFRMNKDGSKFTILRSFTGSGAEGSHPRATLTLIGDTLYGATYAGGRNENGVLFRIKTNGKDFLVLRRFGESLDAKEHDGIEPYGDLTPVDNVLFGMTRRGGNGGGTIYRYRLSTP